MQPSILFLDLYFMRIKLITLNTLILLSLTIGEYQPAFNYKKQLELYQSQKFILEDILKG